MSHIRFVYRPPESVGDSLPGTGEGANVLCIGCTHFTHPARIRRRSCLSADLA